MLTTRISSVTSSPSFRALSSDIISGLRNSLSVTSLTFSKDGSLGSLGAPGAAYSANMSLSASDLIELYSMVRPSESCIKILVCLYMVTTRNTKLRLKLGYPVIWLDIRRFLLASDLLFRIDCISLLKGSDLIVLHVRLILDTVDPWLVERFSPSMSAIYNWLIKILP